MRDLLKLAALLQQIVEEENLQGQFEWPVPADCPIAVPDFAGDCLKQNVYLKEHSAPQLRAHYWLIQQWGGIKSFKQNPQNDRKILQFLEALAAAEPSSKRYDRLPYLSKVSSFLMPDDYVIYDARSAKRQLRLPPLRVQKWHRQGLGIGLNSKKTAKTVKNNEQYSTAAPRIQRPAGAGIPRIYRPRCPSEMDGAARLYRACRAFRRAHGRQLPHVIYQFFHRNQAFISWELPPGCAEQAAALYRPV